MSVSSQALLGWGTAGQVIGWLRRAPGRLWDGLSGQLFHLGLSSEIDSMSIRCGCNKIWWVSIDQIRGEYEPKQSTEHITVQTLKSMQITWRVGELSGHLLNDDNVTTKCVSSRSLMVSVYAIFTFSHSGRKAQMSHCCAPGRSLYKHRESDKLLSFHLLSDWSITEKSLDVDDLEAHLDRFVITAHCNGNNHNRHFNLAYTGVSYKLNAALHCNNN